MQWPNSFLPFLCSDPKPFLWLKYYDWYEYTSTADISRYIDKPVVWPALLRLQSTSLARYSHPANTLVVPCRISLLAMGRLGTPLSGVLRAMNIWIPARWLSSADRCASRCTNQMAVWSRAVRMRVHASCSSIGTCFMPVCCAYSSRNCFWFSIEFQYPGGFTVWIFLVLSRRRANKVTYFCSRKVSEYLWIQRSYLVVQLQGYESSWEAHRLLCWSLEWQWSSANFRVGGDRILPGWQICRGSLVCFYGLSSSPVACWFSCFV